MLLVHLFVLRVLSFFSSSWYRGLAAVCDCGIPWTFLLTFSNVGLKLGETESQKCDQDKKLQNFIWMEIYIFILH